MHQGRIVADEYKAAEFTMLDRKMNLATGQFIVDAYVKGDPVSLRWRRFLMHNAQLFPLPNRAAWSTKYSNLMKLMHRARIEAMEKLAAARGAKGVEKII